MRLRHLLIESFRGIKRLELPLDPTTVVIGENNHGKTSIVDVLGLCLGRPGSPLPAGFRHHDFHRPSDGSAVQPIRLVLTFAGAATADSAEARLAPAIVRDEGGESIVRVEFRGRTDNGDVQVRFLDAEAERLDPQPPPDALETLRRIHPVIVLRFSHGVPQGIDDLEGASDAIEERRGRLDLEGEVARVYRELTFTRGPVPPETLQRGLGAARSLYRRIREERATGLGPLQGMLEHLVEDAPERPHHHPRGLAQAGSGSHTLGVLMVLGALLEGRGEEGLADDTHPIIAIEEPETHLHPILLASTWDVIESLRAQTLVTTNSGELLSSVPMVHLRRLVRRDGHIQVHHLREGSLSERDLRRVGYHIRSKRGSALFARCWLLVEGETEFWLLRQLAHVLGYDLDAEGVELVEFAQCGVEPLVKLANDLGIEWHLLADGDNSGKGYTADAMRHLDGARKKERITRLKRRDVERTFWYGGFQDVYLEAAGFDAPRDADGRPHPPGRVIAKAVRARSKPYLAITVAEACAARGPKSVPLPLKRVIENSVRLAREAIR